MTPQQRKAASEQAIRALGIKVNEHLPLIEAEEEIEIRSVEEVLERLIALWAVAGAAMLPGNTYFREYITGNNLQKWLSKRELEFLLSAKQNEHQIIQFSWQLEALYFIAWCAGLIDQIAIPFRESSVKEIMALFPHEQEPPDLLRSAIRLRTKSEVLNQADLLYRLHWAVRNARIREEPDQPQVIGGVVQEWHRAVNWMTRYDQENNWDYVATDT
jgi:hypothetical protein